MKASERVYFQPGDSSAQVLRNLSAGLQAIPELTGKDLIPGLNALANKAARADILTAKNRELADEIQQLRESASTATQPTEGNTAELKLALESAASEKKQAQERIASLESDLRNFEEKKAAALNELHTQLTAAQEDAAEKLQELALKLSYAEKLAADVTARNEALILERDEAKSESAELRKTFEEMQTELAAQKAKANRLPALEAELLTANRQKAESAQTAEETLRKLANATSSESEVIQRLQQELADAQQALRLLQASSTSNAVNFAEQLRAAAAARDQEKAKADSFTRELEELRKQLEQTNSQFTIQLNSEREAKVLLEKLLAQSKEQVQNLETTLKRLQEKQALDHSTQTPSLMYSDSCAQTERQADPTDEIKTKYQELGIAIDLLWGRYGTRNQIKLRTAPSGIDPKKWAEFLKAKAKLDKIVGIVPTALPKSATPKLGAANTAHTDSDSSGETADDDGDNDALDKPPLPSASVTPPFAAAGAGLKQRKTAPGSAFNSSERPTAAVELLKHSEDAAANDKRHQSAVSPLPKKAAALSGRAPQHTGAATVNDAERQPVSTVAKFPAPKPAGKPTKK